MASTSWAQGKNTEDSTMKLSHPLHANSILTALNDTRKNPRLCDGTLLIADSEIPVQRNVLAAASPYFRALYSYDMPMKVPDSGKTTLNIENLTSAIFEQILEYIYTSVIDLSEENIQDILQAADILLMTDLKELCCEYLEQCITVANCLGIKEFTDRFSCPRVCHQATNFMDENFLEISYTEEFLSMSAEKVKDILKRSSLVIQTEDAVFDCIMRWIRHDSETRRDQLQDILTTCVHMGLLDERYVQEHVIADELIRSLHLENFVLRMRMEDKQKKQRGYTNMIVVTGGEGSSTRDPEIVEIKNHVRCTAFHGYEESRTCAWINLTPMLSPRIGHGMVEAGGYLYVIGGRDDSGRILNTGERYDPSNNVWAAIPQMNHARVGFGLMAVDDKIYAIGGSNDMSDPLTSVEEFNIYTNKWRRLPDMNLKRAWSAHAVCNKKIYVIAGGIMGKLYEAVECFDPKSETWVSVAPMKERRFDARAIGMGEDIFVFGGFRRFECPSAIQSGSGMKFCGTEVYSTEQKHWMMMNRNMGMCTMTDSSHIDAVTKCKDEIILIGDLDVGGMRHCVRAFRPGTNNWRGVVQNHPTEQRAMQSCILKIPSSLVYDLTWQQDKLTWSTVRQTYGPQQMCQMAQHDQYM